jgi:PAS domain S-box-containing protein
MTTRRSSGPQGHAAKSALSPWEETIATLYPEILRGLPLGVVLLHLEMPEDATTLRIVDLNPAAADLTGSTIEFLRGKRLADFPGLLKTSFPGRCLDAFRARELKNLGDISYGDEHIRQGIYSVQVYPLSQEFLAVAFENVTERRHAEHQIRESEERFRLLVEGVRDYALFQLDPGGHVMSWNTGAERLKGYSAKEIIGKHFAVFYPPADVQSGKPAEKLAEAERKGQSRDEGWRTRKDGSRFWASVVITALRNARGDLQGFAKLTRDMTEQREKLEALKQAKQELELRVEQRTAVLLRVNEELRTEVAERELAEEKLKMSLEQLRALAARLQLVREEERTSVAREIHDELGQACTAIKMDLALIGRKATKRQTQLQTKVLSAMQLADNMISSLRRIASELRPGTLDDLGLTAALEWQAQEFQSRTGIQCNVILPHEPLTLDPERSTAIFRIFQESLTNVARHAQATRVVARLEAKADALILEVRDNGKGFNAQEPRARRSLGLVGMQERALLLNGELNVEGVPGAGTTMTLRIPLPPSTLPGRDLQ